MSALEPSTYGPRIGRKGIEMQTERIDTVVIGAGQAGLSAGYYLKKSGRSFVLLDASPRVGDCVAQPV